MRILTYKRTHFGDPSPDGLFGVNDCMGRVRNWNFDAVIGVGALNPWVDSKDIAGKLTWIGFRPFRIASPERRGDMLMFRTFLLLDDFGPALASEAPLLAHRILSGNVRSILHSYTADEKAEAVHLIKKYIAHPQCIHFEKSENIVVSQRKCVPRYKTLRDCVKL